MKKIVLITLAFLSFGEIANAVPITQYAPTLLPISNNLYDLGTSTKAWRNLYISGTCTGCGSSGTVGTSTADVSGYATFFTSNSATPAKIGGDSNYFWDNTNKRLGLGTTSPSQALSVQGNALVSGNISAANITATGTLSAGTTTVTNLIVTNTSSSTFAGPISNTSGNLIVAPTGTSNNLLLNPYGGNVGIGSTSPSKILSVQGNYYVSGTSFFGGAITATSSLTINQDRTNGTNVVGLVLSDNLTGLSTAGFGNAIDFLSNSGNVRSRIVGGNGGTGTNNESEISFQTQNVAGALTKQWTITSTGVLQSNGAQTIQSSTGNLTLATAAGNGNILLTPNGSGNVGIGTTGPTGKLDVLTATDGTPTTISAFDTRHAVFGPGTADGVAISKTTGGSGYITSLRPNVAWDPLGFQASNYNWYLAGSATASLVLNSSGNVGIGTTTPGRLLNLYGSAPLIQLDTSGASGSSGIFGRNNASGAVADDYFVGNASLDFASAGQLSVGAISNMPVVFATNNTERMRISAGGQVGIGSTTPGNLLVVKDASARAQAVFHGYGVSDSRASDASGSIQLGINTVDRGILTYSDAGNTTLYMDNTYDNASAAMQFRMRTNGTPVNALTILGSGNVGIGTTSPTAKLAVSTGDSTTRLLALATTTGAEVYSVDTNGYRTFKGDAPSTTACGSGSYAIGTDSHGIVYSGSGAITSCTLTFAYTHPVSTVTLNVCTASQVTGTAINFIASTTASTLVISSASVITSDAFTYDCALTGGK